MSNGNDDFKPPADGGDWASNWGDDEDLMEPADEEASAEVGAPEEPEEPDAPESEDNEDEPTPLEENQYLMELLDDPELRGAVQSGELRRFFESLAGYRERADDPDEIVAIDYARWNPHEFIEPAGKAPSMFTLNGFGTRLIGKKDLDPSTGFRVSTLFITLLFIPFIPIRRYLVRSDNDKDYEFYGKIGLTSAQSGWRKFVGFGFLAFVLFIAAIMVYGAATYEPDVQIINALDRPVELSVDDGERTFEISPRTMKSTTIPAGNRQFTTRFRDGTIIEELAFEVPSRKDLVVYNIAGLAPAVVESATYFDFESETYQSGAYLDHEEEIDLLAGVRSYVRDSVDYIDEEPPEEIELSRVPERTVHWYFYYDNQGPELSLHQLQYWEPERIDDFVEVAMGLEPDEDWYQLWLWSEINSNVEADPERAKKWIERVQQAAREHPEVLAINRLYIELNIEFADRLGLDDIESEYRRIHEERDTATSAFLLSHTTVDGEEEEQLLARVIDEGARSPEVAAAAHRSYGIYYYRADGDCESTVEHLDASRELDAELSDMYLAPYASCLVELGRHEVALEVLRQAVHGGESSNFTAALLYGQVVVSTDAEADPFEMIEASYRREQGYQLDDDSRLHFANAMGLSVGDEQLATMSLSEWGQQVAGVNETLYDQPHTLLTSLREAPELFDISVEITLLINLLAGAEQDQTLLTTLRDYGMEHYLGAAELERATGGYQFEGAAPANWSPSERAAYYVAQAHLLDDIDDQRDALNTALAQTPLWGPSPAIATAMLEELE